MNDPRRVALVTEVGDKHGQAIARALAERGMQLVVASAKASACQRASQRLRAEGFDVDARELDVTDDSSIEALARHIADEWTRLDVLVNHSSDPQSDAGMGDAGILDGDLSTLRHQFDVAALGAARCCRMLVPLMRSHRYGRIVNVSSELAVLGGMNPDKAARRVGLVALSAVTRVLAGELDGTGIKINAACFGEGGGALEEDVDTAVWLATLRSDGPTGGFFRHCKAIAW